MTRIFDKIYPSGELLREHKLCMELCLFSYTKNSKEKIKETNLGELVYKTEIAKPLKPLFFIIFNNDRKECYIVVRGTKNFFDVISDVDGRFVIFNGSPSHSGFVLSGQNVINTIPLHIFDKIVEGGYKVYFTGHSLGGASAVIASIYFKQKFPDVPLRCVTFGSPPVFNEDVSAQLKSYIDSVVCIGDPVPFLCVHNFHPFNSYKSFKLIVWSFLRAALATYPKHVNLITSESHSIADITYPLLVPAGNIYALGVDKGTKKVFDVVGVRLLSYAYFNGVYTWLSAGLHRYSFYIQQYNDMMDRFVENNYSVELQTEDESDARNRLKVGYFNGATQNRHKILSHATQDIPAPSVHDLFS